MAGRRLTRKEIVQEDQIHSTINQIFLFLVEKRNLLLTILGCAVVLGVAIYFWVDFQVAKKAELQLAFSRAQEMFDAAVGEAKPSEPNAPPDTRLRYKTENDKYTAALKAFSELKTSATGTPIAQYARYYEVLCSRGLGRYEEYLKSMEEIANAKDMPEVSGLAAYSLGDNFLARGDITKAQQHFDQVLKDEKTTIPKDSILSALADYYEKHDDKAKARATFERLVKEYPDSNLKRQAEARLAQLGPAEKK